MQVLKSIEDNFNSFSIRVKLEFFLIPILIVVVFIYIIKDSEVSGNSYKNTHILNKIQNMKMSEKMVNIIKNIEVYANENSLKILSISNTNRDIKIQINANKSEQIRFMKYLEAYNSFSKIKSFQINQENINIELSFGKVYFKDEINLENKILDLEQKKVLNLNLHAIIDKKALINDKWLEINENLNEYKIIKIDSNSVILENEFETIKLKVYKNENI